MGSLSPLSIRVPSSAVNDLVSLFVGTEVSEGSLVEILINISDTEINARELAAYLNLADRIYGRLTIPDLRRYSRWRGRQLEITQIQKGSIEINITEVISQLIDAKPYIILGLFLKYLPTTLKAISEATKNFADSYKSFQEGQLAKENRKKIAKELEQDEFLSKLTEEQGKHLVRILRGLRASEKRLLPAATRFARLKITSVRVSFLRGKK